VVLYSRVRVYPERAFRGRLQGVSGIQGVSRLQAVGMNIYSGRKADFEEREVAVQLVLPQYTPTAQRLRGVRGPYSPTLQLFTPPATRFLDSMLPIL